MGVLSFLQIEQLEEDRGATPQQAQTGAAIVEAESGGDTAAWGDRGLGPGTGQYVGSLGIWQIYGAAHPQISSACAQEPECATDAARQISSNWTDWTPWSTFNSGAYREHLGGAALGGGGGGGGTNAATVARVTPQNLWDGVVKLWDNVLHPDRGLDAAASQTLQDVAWRATLVLFGIVLVTVGVMILFRPTSERAIGAVLPTPRRLVGGS